MTPEDHGQADRIAVLETALELACADGWPDGEHVAKLYIEQAERKLAAVYEAPR